MIDKKAKERFWNKVDKTPGFGRDGDCWIWTAYKNKKGYGQFGLNGKMKRSHRISWMIEHNQDPGELQIHHSCDNPACVNPKHLNKGTNQDNMDDKVKKGRQLKGEKNGRAKLSEDEVRKIDEGIANGRTQRSLANEFGVSFVTISYIKNRKLWKHIK